MARSRTDLKRDQDQRCVDCAKPLQERDVNANTAPQSQSNTASDDNSKPKDKTPAKGKRLVQKDQPTTAASLSDIHLEGEETESVPIYATCNDIRRDIKAYLSKTSSPKTALARELSNFIVRQSTTNVTPRHIDSLLKMKGPRDGAHNPAFYAAYVFFEKIRIRDGKKKGVRREKMEEIWAKKGGMPREGSHNMRLFCHETERWCIDQYGCVQIWQRGPGGTGMLISSEAH